jgi:transposase
MMTGHERCILFLDVLRQAIEPLLLKESAKPKGGHPRVPDRSALGGIVVVLRAGCPWLLLPHTLGGGSDAICWRLRDWQEAGVWQHSENGNRARTSGMRCRGVGRHRTKSANGSGHQPRDSGGQPRLYGDPLTLTFVDQSAAAATSRTTRACGVPRCHSSAARTAPAGNPSA